MLVTETVSFGVNLKQTRLLNNISGISKAVIPQGPSVVTYQIHKKGTKPKIDVLPAFKLYQFDILLTHKGPPFVASGGWEIFMLVKGNFDRLICNVRSPHT